MNTSAPQLPHPDQPGSTPQARPRFSFGILFSVTLLAVIICTVITFLLPEQYASKARIRVERDQSDIANLMQTQSNAGLYDPYFIQTEFEVIQSEVILVPVVMSLKLNVEWGKKYLGPGQVAKTAETMLWLKARMDLRPVRNTSLIDIQVSSDDPREAANLANAIAETYRNYRIEKRKQLTRGGVEVTDLVLPKTTMVEIVDSAVPAIRPYRPNKSLNILLGLVVGGLAGLILSGYSYLLQVSSWGRRTQKEEARLIIRRVVRAFVALSLAVILGWLCAGVYFGVRLLPLVTMTSMAVYLLIGINIFTFTEVQCLRGALNELNQEAPVDSASSPSGSAS